MATVNAVSPDRDDVAAAIGAASVNDTVVVPAGSATWTTQLYLGKPITLQGAGVGQTIITNTQGTGSGTPGTYDYASIMLPTYATGRQRVTGFEFRGSETAQGILVQNSDATSYHEFQIDNCKFYRHRGRAVRNIGRLSGLIHSCVFEDNFKSCDTYGDGITPANNSWKASLTLGTVSCVVVEDCEFVFNSWYPTTTAACCSHGRGARTTWRYNTFNNNFEGKDFSPVLDAHGNQLIVNGSNEGNSRSSRQFEVYANTFNNNTSDPSGTLALVQIRGGTFLAFDNTVTGDRWDGGWQMREEDGPARFWFINPAEYPGYDQHWVWIWSNLLNGSPMNGMNYYNDGGESEEFVQYGVNAFARAPQSGDPNVIPGRQIATPSDAVYPYTPLVYPHPWRGADPPPPDPGGGGTTNARRRMLAMLLSR